MRSIIGGNGVFRFTEARGINFAAQQADQLGFELVGSLTYANKGIDLVFTRKIDDIITYAIWEAKGGVHATGIGHLSQTGGGQVTQGSTTFIQSRLERYIGNSVSTESGRALARTLQRELLAGRLESYASFYQSGRTFRLRPDPDNLGKVIGTDVTSGPG